MRFPTQLKTRFNNPIFDSRELCGWRRLPTGGRAALRDGHGRSLVDRGGSVVGSYGTYQDKSDLAGAGSRVCGVCQLPSLLVARRVVGVACVGYLHSQYLSTYDFKFQM